MPKEEKEAGSIVNFPNSLYGSVASDLVRQGDIGSADAAISSIEYETLDPLGRSTLDHFKNEKGNPSAVRTAAKIFAGSHQYQAEALKLSEIPSMYGGTFESLSEAKRKAFQKVLGEEKYSKQNIGDIIEAKKDADYIFDRKSSTPEEKQKAQRDSEKYGFVLGIQQGLNELGKVDLSAEVQKKTRLGELERHALSISEESEESK